MEKSFPSPVRSASAESYWLTRFVMLRWFGFIYLVAFFVAWRQLVPLVGSDGLTPASLFFKYVGQNLGGTFYGFLKLPTLFWINCSDEWLRVVPAIGIVLSALMLAGYANAISMAVLWMLYMSIVNVGQDWYGYGWEIQMLETGFLATFLCPLLDPRPFPKRAPPTQIIFLFRWLIIRIMLGSALIKLRGDSCWRDLTALYYHFETQPIPNPISRWFDFLPHPLLQFGVIWTFVVELIAPFFAIWPRIGRTIAALAIISFQFTLIVSGNLSFFNWLTILPALACFDDRFWKIILPNFLVSFAMEARLAAKPCLPMIVTAWVVTALIVILSIQPALNLLSPDQAMNTSYDPLHLVNTYGAFGSVGRVRDVVVFEGTDSDNPETATDWKQYPYVALPWDPKQTPVFIAPYQPHLDWQMWFAAMATYREYPWTINLVYKLLHNDPVPLSLFASNPFPDHPPRYIRATHYIYHFAPPGNSDHVYWTRELVGPWLPPLSADSPELLDALKQAGWLQNP